MGYYLDDDGDPIEYDDTPEDDYADHLPDFWTGPPETGSSSEPTREYGAPWLPVADGPRG